MEKAKITIRPREEGLKVVVKAKETKRPDTAKPTGLSMDKQKNDPLKEAAGVRVNPVREKKEKRSFIDAAKKYQFNKVFQAEEPPETHVLEWGSPHNAFFQKRKPIRRPSSSNLTQILLSIGGAILVGTVMGCSVLNLFFSDKSVHSTSSIDDHLPAPAKSEVQKEKESTPSKAATSISLPSLNVVMLQAGNFTEREGAEQTVQAYRTRGLAAVMSEQAPYRIFLGMGLNRDDALKLSAIYQKQDVHVYLKDWNIRGSTTMIGTEQASELPAIIQTGHQIFQKLARASVKDIHADPTVVPSTFAFDPEILNQHRKFVTECQTIEAVLPQEAREPLTEMTRAIDQAVQSGQEAKNNPSQALLWQIQEGLVRYAASYERLIQTLTK